MNINKVILQASVLSVALLSVMVSFGMNELVLYKEQPRENKDILSLSQLQKAIFKKKRLDADEAYYQPQTNVPLELIVDVAARGDGEVKNKLRQTCKFFCDTLSKKSNNVLLLMKNPLFTPTYQDLRDIHLNALWNNLDNKDEILDVVNSRFGGICPFTERIIKLEDIPKLKSICRIDQVEHFEHFLEEKFELYWKENINHDLNHWEILDFKKIYFHTVLTDLLNIAALNDDRVAMKATSLKIRDLNCIMSDDYCAMTHIYVLMHLVIADKPAAFEFVIKQNPFGIIGSHWESKKQSLEQKSFLEHLNALEYRSQDLKDKFSAIYKKHGGRVPEEFLKRKKRRKK